MKPLIAAVILSELAALVLLPKAGQTLWTGDVLTPRPVGALSQPLRLAEGPTNASGDDFAFRLKNELLAREKNGNLCFSPLSMQVCLSLLLNGAAGGSIDPLRSTLSIGSATLEEVNEGNRVLLASLAGANFTTGNSIWLRSSVSPKSDFTHRLQDSYNAEFFAVPDFDSSTYNRIDGWVSLHTKGRIKKLFDAGPRQAVAVLVNTITFDGEWKVPFDPKQTRLEKFTTGEGAAVPVEMMHTGYYFDYARDDDAEAVRLPYSDGRYAMICILPRPETNASDLAKRLDAEGFRGLMKKLKKTYVEVSLPRFSFSSSFDMVPPLGAMGLAPLYEAIDLSGISQDLATGLSLTTIVQKTWIKVDEKGTQAGAASGLEVELSVPPFFLANRPFLFAIVQENTGAILFVGMVQHPSNQNAPVVGLG